MEARGKSSALSAANAIANHLKDWLSTPTVGENLGVTRDEEVVAGRQNNPKGGVSSEYGEDSGSVRGGNAAKAAGTARRIAGGRGREGHGGKAERHEERGDRGGRLAVMAHGSMGVSSDGNPYGVPDGLFCSFPVACGEGTRDARAGVS